MKLGEFDEKASWLVYNLAQAWDKSLLDEVDFQAHVSFLTSLRRERDPLEVLREKSYTLPGPLTATTGYATANRKNEDVEEPEEPGSPEKPEETDASERASWKKTPDNADLTYNEFRVLRAIGYLEDNDMPVSYGAVKRHVDIAYSTYRNIVNRLEKEGLIETRGYGDSEKISLEPVDGSLTLERHAELYGEEPVIEDEEDDPDGD